MNISDLHGIDISSYQAGISSAAINGNDFAILKIADGRSKDWCFDTFYSQATIPVGAYVYSYATTEERAREEAIKAVEFAQGRALPLGIYIDIEEQSQLALRDSALTAVVKAFCDTVKAKGYRAGAYGSRLNLWGKVGPSFLGDDVLVWVASYGFRPTTGDFWQFAPNDHIEGYNDNVDGNKVLSERFAQLVADIPTPAPEPQPEPQPAPSDDGIFLPTLQQGDGRANGKYRYVRQMQTALIDRGYSCGWMGADGDFGANTKIALYKYKKSLGIEDPEVTCSQPIWKSLLE